MYTYKFQNAGHCNEEHVILDANGRYFTGGFKSAAAKHTLDLLNRGPAFTEPRTNYQGFAIGEALPDEGPRCYGRDHR